MSVQGVLLASGRPAAFPHHWLRGALSIFVPFASFTEACADVERFLFNAAIVVLALRVAGGGSGAAVAQQPAELQGEGTAQSSPATGVARAPISKAQNDQAAREKEEQVAKYIEAFMADKSLSPLPLGAISSIGGMGVLEWLCHKLARAISTEVFVKETITQWNEQNAKPESQLFGHQLVFQLAGERRPLKHRPGAAAALPLCEAAVDVLMEKGAFRMDAVPAALKKPFLVNVLRLVDGLYRDTILGLGALASNGRFRLRWDDLGEREFDMEDFRAEVEEAYLSLDLPTVELEAHTMAEEEEPSFPGKVDLCRVGILLLLVHLRLLCTYCELYMVGQTVKATVRIASGSEPHRAGE